MARLFDVFAGVGGGATGDVEEEAFEGGAGVAEVEELGGGLLGDEGADGGEDFGGGVAEEDFGLVFDAHEIGEEAFADEFAFVDDADAVADFLDLFEEVGGEDDGDALGAEGEDEVADFAGAAGVDAGGGFVEDEEAGAVDDGLGEADALEHAFGVAGEGAIGGVFEVDEVEEFGAAVAEGGAADAAEFAVEGEGFAAGEVAVEVGVFGEEADVFAAVDAGGVAAEDGAGALGGAEEAEEDLHGGAFAGAVGADEAVDLAWGDFEGDVVHGGHGLAPEGGQAEDAGEVLDGDGGGGGHGEGGEGNIGRG